ncbi:hypothetical protein O1611_g9271 [Lasiodiplodia mahajangana]|uniref:Uncharacterized protein n=1 Tax=Lasiodiplodia mahajangana TaxID=1108764 RepID=A0ACC2JA38_9PEZI|nr:hypothetical protein O1611_g9271 [Lasiodiplodia mahajangana]
MLAVTPRLGGDADDGRDDHSYDDHDYYMRGGRGPEDGYYDDRERGRRSPGRSHSRGRSSSVSGSDLGDSDTEKEKTSKMRRKQLFAAGIATVATIHAAHNAYSTMQARNERHKAVQQGKLSPEEARKLKTKAIMQDAASVGVAALGIKGAIAKVKAARDQNNSITEFKQERERRHQRRIERLRRANDDQYGRPRANSQATSSAPQEHHYHKMGTAATTTIIKFLRETQGTDGPTAAAG